MDKPESVFSIRRVWASMSKTREFADKLHGILDFAFNLIRRGTVVRGNIAPDCQISS